MDSLLVIPPSHYCEKVRWALDRYEFPYEEEAHAPPFHRLRTRGHPTVPVLLRGGRALGGSAAILRALDAEAPAEKRLYPEDAQQRAEVEQWEDLFDRQLGPHSRRLAYFHLLPHRDKVLPLLTHGVPRWEAALVGLLFPLLRRFMARGLRIDAAGAERSRARVREVFEVVASRLTGPYLVGERFTAADLTFASLASGVLAPPEYGARVRLPQLSAEQHAEVESFRNHAAGQFALRLYRQERFTGQNPPTRM